MPRQCHASATPVPCHAMPGRGDCTPREAYLEVVPSGLVHLQKEKNCEGMHPGNSYQRKS